MVNHDEYLWEMGLPYVSHSLSSFILIADPIVGKGYKKYQKNFLNVTYVTEFILPSCYDIHIEAQYQVSRCAK